MGGVGGGREHLSKKSWCIFSFQSWDPTLPINRLSQGIHDMTQISIIDGYMKIFK